MIFHLKGIKPRLNQSKRRLTFNQFGFKVETETLEFNLKCVLYLGPAPECPTANANARQARPETIGGKLYYIFYIAGMFSNKLL